MKHLQIKFEHKNATKVIEFWDKQLMLTMSIRSNLSIYTKFVEKNMQNEAANILENCCKMFDEMKDLQIEMQYEINKIKLQEVTKTQNYGKVIMFDKNKKAA